MIDAVITSGLGSVLYGLLRVACWIIIGVVSHRASLIGGTGGKLLTVGCFANAVTASGFLLANAEISLFPGNPVVQAAEVMATPAMVMFTLGFVWESIRVAGLTIGE